MAASDDDARRRALEADVRRYRQAAYDALEQLDWCIGFFHGSRNVAVASALARNRIAIRRRLLRQAAQPTPSAVTHQT